MKKKVLVLTAVMLVSALVFAACQQAAPTEEAAMADTAAPAEEAAPAEDAMEALSGQLQIAGSTTVQPLAEELAAEFMAANPDVSIDIQGGGSSVGVTSAGDGTVDLGAASREVKDSEFETYPDLQVITIAYDGIAIVVNPDVALDGLTKDQVQAIFAGEVTNFSEVGGPDAPITVVSREEGSGTRAAFEELVMEYKDDAGEKQVKPIVESALLQQSNGQVRTVVSTTPNSIAFLSFGFLDDSVKGVPVDGVEPTVANVKNGSYSIFRPLNLLSNGDPSPLAQAFLDYILSDGQSIVAEDYITVTEEETMEEAAPAAALSGQMQMAGSTTVQPLAEELAAAFMDTNPDVSIDIQGGGSSVGVTSAGDGTVDLGAASREIKDSEFETYPDLQVFTIAYDGIAIVVNPDVALDGLTKDQVQAIFAGEVTNFSEVGGPDAPITVVSREEGSGTRAAFEELVMEYKDDAGEKQVKPIVETALLQQSNGQVRTVVSTTPNTIAFLSFGFLDDSVKGVAIDGVEPTVDNVKNGSYSIFRPLNLLSNGDPSPLAQAFLDYILGDGQSIVAEDYITVSD
ncbi:MAG: phosphate transport system substrate-binding protein [Chloroflexota bacterium]|nr:phosphate transport system substrate-binding protein [Chloroflexota bacterium]